MFENFCPRQNGWLKTHLWLGLAGLAQALDFTADIRRADEPTLTEQHLQE